MEDKFTSEYIEQLAHRFRQGTLSVDEEADFEEWYNIQNRKELDLTDSEFESAEHLGTKLHEAILMRLDLRPIQPKRNLTRVWKRLSIAAAILLALGSVLVYFVSLKDQSEEISAGNDVAPGRNAATLTLSDGRKVIISETPAGKFASQSGVVITKLPDGSIFYESSDADKGNSGYNVLETTKGEQTTIRLPDGSLVFLNAASSIRFPASFAGLDKRIVELSGEGYFEIAKEQNRPFIVKTGKQNVEVLGTHFNVNSYPEESGEKTTLLEGRVKLVAGQKSRVLNPGEQGVLERSEINVRQVDTEEIIAWKNNEFLFKDDDFRTNMRKIARWYDLEIIYEADAPEELRLGGFLSRNRKLSTVIRLLESTGNVHFRLSGKKLYVRK